MMEICPPPTTVAGTPRPASGSPTPRIFGESPRLPKPNFVIRQELLKEQAHWHAVSRGAGRDEAHALSSGDDELAARDDSAAWSLFEAGVDGGFSHRSAVGSAACTSYDQNATKSESAYHLRFSSVRHDHSPKIEHHTAKGSPVRREAADEHDHGDVRVRVFTCVCMYTLCACEPV